MSIAKKLMVQPVAGSVAPEGVDFDGTNDYLSRSSDLTGNADGKTFTISAWVYKTGTANECVFFNSQSTSPRVKWGVADTGDVFECTCQNSAGSNVLSFQTTTKVPRNTWVNILCSVDLTNTSNRYVYFNDVAASVTWSTYANDNIDFTHASGFYVGKFASNPTHKGRLAHVYLDYTYRDLSNSANRRLFIDADLKPAAGQASLSPILYLPMTDADTAHVNEGTGGDFAANGTFATSQRGPNQYNCVASDFDGASDKLTTSSLSNWSGKTLTISYVARLDGQMRFEISSQASSTQYHLRHTVSESAYEIYIANSAGTLIVNITQGAGFKFPSKSNALCQVVIDTANPSNCNFYINNVAQPKTVTTLTNDNISLGANAVLGDTLVGGTYSDGKVGEFYFDTTYTDLSTDNPFWDADANRPKPVRQVLEETGNTPLIALPIEASNAGLNLGTGGDFTVNSGPYTGARGGSEYWARSIKGDGSTGYLNNNATGVSDSKTFSLVFSFKATGASNLTYMNFTNGTFYSLEIFTEFSVTNVIAKNSSGTVILDEDWAGFPSGLTTGQDYVFLVSVDLNAGVTAVYHAHTLLPVTSTTKTNDTIGFSGDDCWISRGRYYSPSDQAIHYFTTDYIDFSQEANRLKFVDAFGYPIDLQPAIDAGDIPNPLVYMKFDDPDALGTNSGTGGNFTVNGTVTQGADVDPN